MVELFIQIVIWQHSESFDVNLIGLMLFCKCIPFWVSKWHEECSVQDAKPQGRPYSFHTPENIKQMLVSIKHCPEYSAVKHASALCLSDQDVQ
jgi:hypothetical protein